MKRGLVLLVVCVACLAVAGTATARDSDGTYRISWDGCDPQVLDKVFTTASIYKFVISGDNFTPGATEDNNLGYDFKVQVRPVVAGPLPDAWRFDDAGCQTGSQISLSFSAFSKACPTMAGGAPLPITQYGVDSGNPAYAEIRLAVAYNDVVVQAGLRYTFWQVSLDHSFSVVAPTTPPNDCGEADAQLCIGVTETVLATLRGDSAKLQVKPGDVNYVTWNTPATCDGVPSVPATWGKVKSLYR